MEKDNKDLAVQRAKDNMNLAFAEGALMVIKGLIKDGVIDSEQGQKVLGAMSARFQWL